MNHVFQCWESLEKSEELKVTQRMNKIPLITFQWTNIVTTIYQFMSQTSDVQGLEFVKFSTDFREILDSLP